MAMTGKKGKRRKYRQGRKADYGDASPEQVARALHRYRPNTARRLKSSL